MLSSQVDPLARESQGADVMLVACSQTPDHRKLNASPGYFENMDGLSVTYQNMIHLSLVIAYPP